MLVVGLLCVLMLLLERCDLEGPGRAALFFNVSICSVADRRLEELVSVPMSHVVHVDRSVSVLSKRTAVHAYAAPKLE